MPCTARTAALPSSTVWFSSAASCAATTGSCGTWDGSCLEIPFPEGQEHEGERIRGRAWQPAYKSFERDGLVFAYMGPPEEEPPFPEWDGDWGLGPGDEMVPYSNFYPCNWLQVQDNAADQYHHIPLHSTAVVPGHEQGTTFGEAGAAPYEVRPDLQFFRVHEGKAMAWTSSRRVDDEKIFIRVNYQFLPNGSFHSYLFEDGSKRNHFSRTHMFRWVVPVDDENCIMFGWRMFGSHCDPRDVGKKHLVGFEKMDFLEGQCGMRRPERLQYGQGELPPIPRHHRERTAYRDAQHAPGDYEAVSSSRKVAGACARAPAALRRRGHDVPAASPAGDRRQEPGRHPRGMAGMAFQRPPEQLLLGQCPGGPEGADDGRGGRAPPRRGQAGDGGHHRERYLAGRSAQAIHAGQACGNRGDVRARAGRGLIGAGRTAPG